MTGKEDLYRVPAIRSLCCQEFAMLSSVDRYNSGLSTTIRHFPAELWSTRCICVPQMRLGEKVGDLKRQLHGSC
jgi:hypothetical protein